MADIKAVLFDMFGTLTNGLANPEARIINAFNLPKNPGYANFADDTVCGTVFTDEESYLTHLAYSFGLQDNPDILDRLRRIFKEDLAQEHLLPEAEEVLKEINGRKIKLGLISDLPNPSYHLVRRAGLGSFFDVHTLSYETGVLKPNERVFTSTLEKLGVEAGEALMVGNSIRSDITPADKLGIRTLLYDSAGKHTNHQGKRISNLREVLDYLPVMNK